MTELERRCPRLLLLLLLLEINLLNLLQDSAQAERQGDPLIHIIKDKNYL
jgi:hypothetical protein